MQNYTLQTYLKYKNKLKTQPIKKKVNQIIKLLQIKIIQTESNKILN